jgi:hypothetical protein
MYGSRTLSTLATLGAQSPPLLRCMRWLHLEPNHLLYYTVYTGYTWSPLTCCTTPYALATLGAHSPPLLHCMRWLHLEPTHLLYYTVYTGYTWSPLTCTRLLTYCTTLYYNVLHCLHWLHLEPTHLHSTTHLLYYTVLQCTALSALATLGAHPPAHLLYYTVCTGYTWSPLTSSTTLSTLAALGVLGAVNPPALDLRALGRAVVRRTCFAKLTLFSIALDTCFSVLLALVPSVPLPPPALLKPVGDICIG